MKKGLLMIMMVIAIITAKAQTPLNENGVYELKVVQEYENINANNIYERTLLALSDVMGSNKHSKTNIDVQDKEGGILVFKGRYFIGYRKVNVSGGYFHYADLTLKVRCKDGKAQYTITVPSLYVEWNDAGVSYETVPLTALFPEYNYKSKLYSVKKGLIEFSSSLDTSIKEFKDLIIKKTKDEADDDF